MSAYMIAIVEVTDPERYREYTKVTPAVIEKFGGRFLVRGGEMLTLEGPESSKRIVVVEFPSMEKARKFYESPEYQAAKKLRQGAATATFVAVQGV